MRCSLLTQSLLIIILVLISQMSYCCRLSTTILFVVVFICSASSSSAEINCVQCNSANDQQSACASSNVTDLTGWVKSCQRLTSGQWNNAAAIGCRKVVQEVDGITQIVRECAYSGIDVENLKRTGNKGIRMFYYQCSNNDENTILPCNTAVFSSIASYGIICLANILIRYIAF
jgi:hypothetical protein